MATEITDEEQRVGKLPLFEGPKLLILTEKHGTSYYFIPNEAHLHAIALQIVRDRWDNDWYGDEEEYKSDYAAALKDLEQDRERCMQIKDQYAQKAALDALGIQVKSVKMDAVTWRQLKAIRFAVENDRSDIALEILHDRASYQYEGFALEQFQGPVGDDGEFELLPQPESPHHGMTWIDEHGDRWVYDQKTIGDWIPMIYASLLYNVEHFQGKRVVRRLDYAELDAYARVDKAKTEFIAKTSSPAKNKRAKKGKKS